jgi:hypothetical protein
MIFFIPNFREWGVFQRNPDSGLTLSLNWTAEAQRWLEDIFEYVAKG